MRSVKVQELVAGQIIAEAVVNLHGESIMPAGTVVAARHVSLLKAWKIVEVGIETGPALGFAAEPEGVPAKVGLTADLKRLFGGNDLTHPLFVELASIIGRLPLKASKVEARSPSETLVPGADARRIRQVAQGPAISPETIVGRVATLASLPNIYVRVDQAINHHASSAADIAAVLRNDQALTARLLRIANSAFYGFSRRIEGIDEAVRVIGTSQLHDLVLATVVLTHFKGVDPNLVSMQSFWRHSLACGIAARSMATLRRDANIERFFVAGLLHDIGSLVLYQQFADRAQTSLERHTNTDMSLEDAERAVLGCDHGAVGAALMSAWKLPQFFREAAANHHSCGHRPHTPGTAVVHIADLLVLALDLGSNGEARLPRLAAEAWDLAGLPLASLGLVVDEVLALLGEAERTFLGDEAAA